MLASASSFSAMVFMEHLRPGIDGSHAGCAPPIWIAFALFGYESKREWAGCLWCSNGKCCRIWAFPFFGIRAQGMKGCLSGLFYLFPGRAMRIASRVWLSIFETTDRISHSHLIRGSLSLHLSKVWNGSTISISPFCIEPRQIAVNSRPSDFQTFANVTATVSALHMKYNSSIKPTFMALVWANRGS